MDINATQRIKKYLEETYDIPFDVDSSVHSGEPRFIIKPYNEGKELFEIEARFKNRIRLIMEVFPEKYAAFSIQDMATSSYEKKKLFAEYARQLIVRKAKIEFFVNGTLCDITNPETWPSEWNSFRLRVSKSPICSEYEDVDEVEVVSSWGAIIMGMFLSLLDVIKVDDKEHPEGGARRIEVNKYERNPLNRELCLAANGYACKVCGFDFEETYGDIGRRFIHVHHIIPVSHTDEVYMIDPVNELIPVCPNCHAMLHRADPPFTPEEIGNRVRRIKQEKLGAIL